MLSSYIIETATGAVETGVLDAWRAEGDESTRVVARAEISSLGIPGQTPDEMYFGTGY